MGRRLILPLSVAVMWLATAAAADVITLQPAQDNTLFEDATGSLSNGAGPVLFAGNNGLDLARRAVLRFDVAGSLPADATIEDVTLTLHVSNASSTEPYAFTLHRVLEAWGEGTSSSTSGSGAPATANDATWLHRFWASSAWSSVGGSFAVTPSGTQSIAGIGFYSWTDPAMRSDVQGWLGNPTGNFGWLVMGDEVTLNTARRFDSRENTVAANRPALTISYTRTIGVAPERSGGFWLEPCRPNPIVGTARLGFVLGAAAEVRLEVLDPAGRRVATLAEGRFPPGRQEATWSERNDRGGKVAAGVYLARLVVNGARFATRRVVVLN